MLNIPNLISFLRIPLAFCFFQQNPVLRSLAVIIALLSDGLDGYLARRLNLTSQLGTLLDPLADKFFVIMAASVLISEGQLNFYEVCILICRDFSVLTFGIYLFFKGNLSKYRFKSIWCGKITTFFQFIVLAALVWKVPIPPYAFTVFITLGLLALPELYFSRSDKLPDTP